MELVQTVEVGGQDLAQIDENLKQNLANQKRLEELTQWIITYWTPKFESVKSIHPTSQQEMQHKLDELEVN